MFGPTGDDVEVDPFYVDEDHANAIAAQIKIIYDTLQMNYKSKVLVPKLAPRTSKGDILWPAMVQDARTAGQMLL